MVLMVTAEASSHQIILKSKVENGHVFVT